MMRTPLVLLCGLSVALPFAAVAQTAGTPAPQGSTVSPAFGASTGAAQSSVTPDAGTAGAPNAAAPEPQAAVPPASAPTAPVAGTKTPDAGKAAALPRPTTGALRNGSASLPTIPGPNGSVQQPGSPSTVTYGGPQPDLQPVYGSPMRDAGTGRNGTPVYNNGPAMPGGPVNGTANAYAPTQPYGSARPGTASQASRGGTSDGNSTYNLKPLGGVPTTRDQFGTYGGRAGYNASGVYNGTASQAGTGYGYGSPYAPIGRPQGGLLSTNVDGTGPLRPYVPLNNSPQGRPNSGYGIPNGSRASHIDGRGIQRVD